MYRNKKEWKGALRVRDGTIQRKTGKIFGLKAYKKRETEENQKQK